jgi:hypothetical protein
MKIKRSFCSTQTISSIVSLEVFLVLLFYFISHAHFNKPIYQPDLFHFVAVSVGFYLLKTQLKDVLGYAGLTSLFFSGWCLFELIFDFYYENQIIAGDMYNGKVDLSASVIRNVTVAQPYNEMFNYHRGMVMVCILGEIVIFISGLIWLIWPPPETIETEKATSTWQCFCEHCQWRKCRTLFNCCPWHEDKSKPLPSTKMQCMSFLIDDVAKFGVLVSLFLVICQLFLVMASLHLHIPLWTYNESILFPLILAHFMHLRLILRWYSRKNRWAPLYYVMTIVMYIVGLVFATWGLILDRDHITGLSTNFFITPGSERDYWIRFSTGVDFGGYNYHVADYELTLWFGRLSWANHHIFLTILIFSYFNASIFICFDVVSRLIDGWYNYQLRKGGL